MGQTAREMGVNSLHFSLLCEPARGLSVGCEILRKKLEAAPGYIHKELQAWSGGGNPDYADEVLAWLARYR